jgi:NAD-dependent dihydropyrimidine dehydrogenase PreA subunit
MAFVITEPCIGVKDASCVSVCPVDCIYTKDEDEMYYINPDECIDCGACAPECPVNAIYIDSDVPDNYKQFVAINADYFKK